LQRELKNTTGMMKTVNYMRLYHHMMITTAIVLISACSGNKELSPIRTTLVTKTLLTSAECNGTLNTELINEILEYGACWSTDSLPDINNNKISDTLKTENFTLKISELEPGKEYYIRTFVQTAQGITYGNTLSFKTLDSTLTDFEGNVYPVVQIGDQVWLAENYRCTVYSDGSPIPSSIKLWYQHYTPVYCWYDYDESYKHPYGALYNWYAIVSDNFCPPGWRIPNNNDWNTLTKHEGGVWMAGSKLKEAGTNHWLSNKDGNNLSGFNAVPGGTRDRTGIFYELGMRAYWWSISDADVVSANYYSLALDYQGVMTDIVDKRYGLSVRLIKD